MTRNPLQLPGVGSTFAGQFELLELIGEGGMGVVYRARQLKLQREVALKVLRPDVLANGYESFRLEREAVSAARFRSRHVVSIYDWGISPDGLTYMVMELLHGETLAQRLRSQGAAKPAQVAAWLQQCSEALDEAAMLGIVHRDIKPANLFLTTASLGTTEIKILDFGITKIFDPSRAAFQHEVTTRSNLRMGTTHYMSPEQLRATSDVDARADIWSLGVVVYQALSGSYPFDSACEADLIVSILSDQPKPLHLLDTKLNRAVSEAVSRALEKNVDSRYRSAGEFSRALSAALTSWQVDVLAPEPPRSADRAPLLGVRFAEAGTGTGTGTGTTLETRASNDSVRAESRKAPSRNRKILAIIGLAFAVSSVLAFVASEFLSVSTSTEHNTTAMAPPPRQLNDDVRPTQTSPREVAPLASTSAASPAASVVRVPVRRPVKYLAPASAAVVAKPSAVPSPPVGQQFERANPYAN
ncbi:MAG TPA: serine/threonine-protein kinase [Polyangiaceae bacterium]|nr:serine/threonine-protein kinase [Polyangiaceae bacterium]